MEKSRNSFSSSIGFILAAAGSAVGLGNIWRFPNLAAKNGGGLFLLVYIIFALTFGFTLLTTEIAIGRKTQESPLTAYSKLNSNFKFLGIITFIVPIIIYPYYCVIGGWVTKYSLFYLSGAKSSCSSEIFFNSFIKNPWQPVLFTIIYSIASFIIVYRGVENGIEKFSRILMPALTILIFIISMYSFFLSYTDSTGTTRTGLQGLSIYFIPNFEGLTLRKFFKICLDAMGQLFYSLSVATGILISYGSYMKKNVNIEKSVRQIEIFDTAIAFFAGMMIIPAVYVFAGINALNEAGPGLMFVTLPKVFDNMGFIGKIIGLIFFIMVLFAALTSSISMLESIVSSVVDRFNCSRKKASITITAISILLSAIVCLGYNIFYFKISFGIIKNGQLLDFLDFISNNILMPVVAILTCILVGWIIKPKTILEEISRNNETFKRKKLYIVTIKYFAPIFLIFILLTSFGIF